MEQLQISHAVIKNTTERSHVPPSSFPHVNVLQNCGTISNQNIDIATVKTEEFCHHSDPVCCLLQTHSLTFIAPPHSPSGNLFYTIKFVILRMLCQWNIVYSCVNGIIHLEFTFFPTQHCSIESHPVGFMYLFLFIVEQYSIVCYQSCLSFYQLKDIWVIFSF